MFAGFLLRIGYELFGQAFITPMVAKINIQNSPEVVPKPAETLNPVVEILNTAPLGISSAPMILNNAVSTLGTNVVLPTQTSLLMTPSPIGVARTSISVPSGFITGSVVAATDPNPLTIV